MRLGSLILVACSVAVAAFAAKPAPLPPSMPVRFEPNQGQVGTTTNDPVMWMARGLDYTFLFTQRKSIFQLGDRSFQMRLEGSNTSAQYEASGHSSGHTNYLTPSFQQTIPAYSRLRRKGVYPGVDMIYYGNSDRLEYDFEVAPKADPARIRMRFEGADRTRLNASGDLEILLGARIVTQRAPVAYQLNAAGDRVTVRADYQLDRDGAVSIRVGDYNRKARLVIDPDIVLTRYFFGSRTDTAVSVTHDNAGFVYIGGNTQSTDFFLGGGNYYFNVSSGGQDAWVAKLNPLATDEDSRVAYATYYGGSGTETLKAIAVDNATGFIYVTGSTNSTNLLGTNAFQTSNQGGTDAFLAVLDVTQVAGPSLVYATYLGGSGLDDARGIAVFHSRAYIVGQTNSTNFPTKNAIAGTLLAGAEAFVSVLDASQSGAGSLVSSTFITGGANDYGRAIAVDAQGKVYIAGVTYSPSIAVTPDAFQQFSSDGGDAFILKLDLDAATVVYGTYLEGTGYEEPKRIVVEPSGRIAVAGYTSSADFPVTQNAYQPQLRGVVNAFLTILDPSQPGLAGLAYSTYFGGSTADVAYDLARDITGKYYFTGYTLSPNLPVTSDALNQVSALGGTDGFFAVLDPGAPPFQSLIYSTYLTSPGNQIGNSVDVDLTNTAYVVGNATDDVFPAGLAVREKAPGNSDGFFLALRFPPPPQALLDAMLAQEKGTADGAATAVNSETAASSAAEPSAADSAAAQTDAAAAPADPETSVPQTDAAPDGNGGGF